MSKAKSIKVKQRIGLGMRILQILLPVLSSLFVIFLTVLGILFASGYSVNFKKRTLVKTGVINIVTRPSGAFIWLNKEPYGKTNKALPNIKVGKYFLELYKDGYFPFKLHVKVEHALATLVHTHLIKQLKASKVAEISNPYFITENGVVWVEWENSQKDKQGTTMYGKLRVVSIVSNLLGGFKFGRGEYRIELPYEGKIEKFAVDLSPNREEVMLLVNHKYVYLGKLSDKIKLEKNDYLSSYLTQGASVSFWGNNYVVILEPDKRVIAYNLHSHSKVLLYDGVGKDVGNKFCTDFKDDKVLIVNEKNAAIVNREGATEASYDLKLLGLKGTNPVFCKLIKVGKKPVVAVVYLNKLILLGPLFKDSTKQIYTLDTFNKARDFKIISLYKENDKNANVVALVAETKQQVKKILPLIDLDKLVIVYKDKIQLFTYNKESPDIMSTIGFKDLYEGKNIDGASLVLGNDYILFQDNGDFLAASIYGENVYKLAEQVNSFYIGEGEKAVLFIRKLDKKPVLFVKEL